MVYELGMSNHPFKFLYIPLSRRVIEFEYSNEYTRLTERIGNNVHSFDMEREAKIMRALLRSRK